MPADGSSEQERDSGAQYIGAFDQEGNWHQEWTLFGTDSDYDTRRVDDEDH